MSAPAVYLLRLGLPAGTHETELTSYDERCVAPRDPMGVPLDRVDTCRLRGLWERTRVAHVAWTAAGRP